MTATYIAKDGRVFTRLRDGRLRECHSALTANARDVERFENVLNTARRQREEHAKTLGSLTGVVEPLDAA